MILIIFILVFISLIIFHVCGENKNIENFRNNSNYYNNRINNLSKRLRNLENKNIRRETREDIEKKKKVKIDRQTKFIESQKNKCKQDHNCINMSKRSGIHEIIGSLNDKLDILNYNVYMDGKRARQIKEDKRQTKLAAAKVIRNKEKMKKDGAKKASQKLAGQSNLSEKQIEMSMLDSGNKAVKPGSELDPNDPEGQKAGQSGEGGTGDGSSGGGSGGSRSGGGGGSGGGGRGAKRNLPKRGGGDNMGPDPYDMQGDVSVAEFRQSERNNNKLDSGSDNSAYEQQQRNKIGSYEKKAEKNDKNEKGIELGGGEAGKDEVDDLKDDPPHSSEFD